MGPVPVRRAPRKGGRSLPWASHASATTGHHTSRCSAETSPRPQSGRAQKHDGRACAAVGAGRRGSAGRARCGCQSASREWADHRGAPAPATQAGHHASPDWPGVGVRTAHWTPVRAQPVHVRGQRRRQSDGRAREGRGVASARRRTAWGEGTAAPEAPEHLPLLACRGPLSPRRPVGPWRPPGGGAGRGQGPRASPCGSSARMFRAHCRALTGRSCSAAAVGKWPESAAH